MELRGRGELLDRFPTPPGVLSAALTYCDITTGPEGRDMTVDERIDEVGLRRGRYSIVCQALVVARPQLIQAVSRTRACAPA